MPFELGEDEESLRERGWNDEQIELRRKHHMPKHLMAPEVREKLAEWDRKVEAGEIAPPRRAGDNFVPGISPSGELYPVRQRRAKPILAEPQSQDHEWDGATLRTTYREDEVARRDWIADAARDGGWAQLFEVLSTGHVNRTRLGDDKRFAPLHQAAWHGAPVEVTQRLIQLGAWRTLRTNEGQIARDIAAHRGHQHLAEILQPAPLHTLGDELVRSLERQLHLLIRGRSAELVLQWRLRLPQLAPITELTEPKLWFPVPGLYGGFAIELHGEELKVSSWNRAIGGWAQTHRVTRDTIQLIDDGWDAPKPQ